MKSLLINTFLFCIMLFTACTVKNELKIVKFEGEYTKRIWSIKELNPEIPSDWTSFGFLTFDMKSSTTQRFQLIIHDAEGLRLLEILPFQGAWVRASIPLIHFQKMNTEGMDQASIWKTPRPGYWIGFTGVVGPVNQIDSLGVAMRLPIGSPTLQIRNIRLTMAPQDSILVAGPLVDEFGQWISADWPGKIKSLDELKSAWSEEERTLQSESSLISKYGGFTGTKAKATGFFHVEKVEGKWWFVDPEGLLFFSTGSNCVGPWSDLSRVKGREYVFAKLPPADEFAHLDQPDRRRGNPSFYTWNLYRRFGTDWYKKWTELTIHRMKSWGLNTIGNWSDPTLGPKNQKTYVATLRGWGIENGVMGMPDIYAPDYKAMVDKAAAKQCVPLKKDPYLLGYFIGNEPPWPDREADLVNVILSGNATPMQAELKKYLASGDSPERRKSFVYETYSKFIDIVCSAIKKYDPNHLNLGFRFGDPPPDEVIAISKKHFDVFSINHYGYTVDLEAIQKINELTGLPIIIGEFHFGTPDRGLASGLAQVKDHKERGVAYSYYIENSAVHPAVIGLHWFQWIDQPNTGRFDGENYNIGFLDVTDQPYPDMVQAAKETYKRLLDVHAGRITPVSRQALVQ
jgi:hypothetical protein